MGTQTGLISCVQCLGAALVLLELETTARRILIPAHIPTSGTDTSLPLSVSYSPRVLLQTCPHVFGTFMHSHEGLNVSTSRAIEPKQQFPAIPCRWLSARFVYY